MEVVEFDKGNGPLISKLVADCANQVHACTVAPVLSVIAASDASARWLRGVVRLRCYLLADIAHCATGIVDPRSCRLTVLFHVCRRSGCWLWNRNCSLPGASPSFPFSQFLPLLICALRVGWAFAYVVAFGVVLRIRPYAGQRRRVVPAAARAQQREQTTHQKSR